MKANKDELPSKNIIIISASIIISFIILAFSIMFFKREYSYVSVEGRAQRTVLANFATWSLNYNISEDTFSALKRENERTYKILKDYFMSFGFKEDDIRIENLYINKNDYKDSVNKFYSSINLFVQTDNIDNMRKASSNVMNLLKDNILISNVASPSYLLTDFDALKVELMREALENAKYLASNMLNGNKINGIKKISQNDFAFTPLRKQTRVEAYESPSYYYNSSHESYPEKVLTVMVNVDFYIK